MRELADAERIRSFMRALGHEADQDGDSYFTDGATAVLIAWRVSTIDVDLSLVPESDRVLRALPRIKDELAINVSVFIAREGRLSFHHFDLHAQALAKVERAHRQDLEDVRALVERGLVIPERALQYFEQIEPELYRYPAIDPAAFQRRVEEMFAS